MEELKPVIIARFDHEDDANTFRNRPWVGYWSRLLYDFFAECYVVKLYRIQ